MFIRKQSATVYTLTFNNRTTLDEMTNVSTNSCRNNEKKIVPSDIKYMFPLLFQLLFVNVSVLSFLLKIHEMNLHSVRESHKVHFYSTEGCIVLLCYTATYIGLKSSCPIFLKLLTAQYKDTSEAYKIVTTKRPFRSLQKVFFSLHKSKNVQMKNVNKLSCQFYIAIFF